MVCVISSTWPYDRYWPHLINRRIGRDLSNTFAKLEKLTIRTYLVSLTIISNMYHCGLFWHETQICFHLQLPKESPFLMTKHLKLMNSLTLWNRLGDCYFPFAQDSLFCLSISYCNLSVFTQDINSLNKQIAGLQELVRSRSGQNGRHLQTHSNTIVVSLQVLTS